MYIEILGQAKCHLASTLDDRGHQHSFAYPHRAAIKLNILHLLIVFVYYVIFWIDANVDCHFCQIFDDSNQNIINP